MNDVDGGVKHLKKMVILAQEGLQKRNAELIDVVVKHPDIYVFGEFIDSPVIAKLQGGEFDDAYRLLELVWISAVVLYILSELAIWVCYPMLMQVCLRVLPPELIIV